MSWPQWRGPASAGITAAEDLPLNWSADSENIRWSTNVPGEGNSSPIVAAGRVFLTTATGSHTGGPDKSIRRIAMAFDLQTGGLVWKQKVARLPKGKRHRSSTFAAATPATDGRSLFVYFGSMIAALDIESGEVQWKRELEADHFATTRYGASSSPVLTSKAVIVVQDQEESDSDGGWMVALDKRSGAELWRVDWEISCCSYSTPLVVDRGSGEELYFVHSGRVASYDAETGEELWRREVPISQMVATPVLDGDLLGVSGGAHNIRHTQFFELQGSGRDTRLELLWATPKYSPHTASPVLYKGRFYAVTDNGVMTSHDARTGRRIWKGRLGPGGYRSSLVAGDDKIYVQGENGTIAVVQVNRKFRIVARNDLGARGINNSSPAVAGGCLLVRTSQRLHCIETESASRESAPLDASSASP